jgi:hypothetical protein
MRLELQARVRLLNDRPDAREELLDLAEDRLLISDPRDMVMAGQLDELRARDSAREKACLLGLHLAVAGAMQHQRRYVY